MWPESTVERVLTTPRIYTFTEQDHADAWREGIIKQINSYDQRWSHKEYGEYNYTDGIYGEIAFAHWSGLERTPAVQGVLTDGGVDFQDVSTTYPDRAVTIDVKATAARGTWRIGRAHLLRPTKYPLHADIYALVVMERPERGQPPTRARFAGWATKRELQEAEKRGKTSDKRPRVYACTRIINEDNLHHDWKGWQ